MKSLILISILLIVSMGSSFSEIKDKRVYDNFYQSCMKEKDASFTYQEMSTYCECSGKAVMKNFTVEELMILEGEILAAGEENEMRVAAANEKLMSIITSCVSKIIN